MERVGLMSDDPELLPCPFCGADGWAHLASDDADAAGSRQYYHCKCLECECSTKGSYIRADAIAAWNRRAAVDARRLLVAYDAITKETPLGHENPTRGASTYNWRMSIMGEMHLLLDTLT